MNTKLLTVSFAIACVASSSAAHGSNDDLVRPDLARIWSDPVFQRQFVGGYGIDADVEPRVAPEEVALLEKVRPFMASDLAKAEAVLLKEMKPEGSATLDFTLAGIRFQQDRVDEAQASFERAVAKFPSFRRAWRNLGLIHVRKGSFDRAIEAFVRMIELGGADAYAYGLLGYAYAAKQDFQPAEAAYRNALLLQPENTEWRLGLTRCAYKQQKFEDCAAMLDVLIERYPDKSDFWMLQAHTFLAMKEPLRAAQDLEAVDRLGKSTVDGLHTLGDVYLGENLVDLAASAYLRAIDRDPSQALARPMRAAEVLAARGAMKQARGIAKHLHEEFDGRMEETDRRKLLKLEARLSMAEGAGDESTAAVLEQIVELDPLDGDALMLLGQHFAKKNEPDRAMFWYERAEGIEAVETNARVRHAQVLVSLGRYADAVPLLRRAQEAKPREDVARYLEQVERLARARK